MRPAERNGKLLSRFLDGGDGLVGRLLERLAVMIGSRFP